MKLLDIYSRFFSPDYLVQIRNIPVRPTIYVFFHLRFLCHIFTTFFYILNQMKRVRITYHIYSIPYITNYASYVLSIYFV
jgi:hypothetical protein